MGDTGRRILYIDMDNVLVDFASGVARIPPDVQAQYAGRLDDIPGVFALMEPLPGAIEAFEELASLFDTYILSTAPWDNPSAWTHKIEWVRRYLGRVAQKRLILSHNKHLNLGDYLVDDRVANGAGQFTGEHLRFGIEPFPDWNAVLEYLRPRA